MGQSTIPITTKIPITMKKDWALMFPSCSHQVSNTVPMDTWRVSPNWSALKIVAKKHHTSSHFLCRRSYPCHPTWLNQKERLLRT
jgi:hypothetical protein